MSGAQLGDLTDATGHGVLVTLPAGLRVVDRAEAVVDRFALLEGAPVEVELRLVDEPVGLIVYPEGAWFRPGP